MSDQARGLLPAVGTLAPDFTLPSTSGTDVTLSSLRGKNVLLAFFPLAFTKVCTQEMRSFTEDYGRFRDANTEVLPISVDSVPTLREFKGKEGISVDLLSDFRREVSRRYGTLLEDKFFSNRAYVLVGPDGRVRWAHAEDTPGTRRENRELLAHLETRQRSV
ncbi:MAG TPA: redoxin domain-containing protein [Gemmatimonadales bacterium]|nr:redoxin domain-containing protein [Gemmatimonadales bacterium]